MRHKQKTLQEILKNRIVYAGTDTVDNVLKIAIETNINAHIELRERNGWTKILHEVFFRKYADRTATGFLQILYRYNTEIYNSYVEKVIRKAVDPLIGYHICPQSESNVFRDINILLQPVEGFTGRFRVIEFELCGYFTNDKNINGELE